MYGPKKMSCIACLQTLGQIEMLNGSVWYIVAVPCGYAAGGVVFGRGGLAFPWTPSPPPLDPLPPSPSAQATPSGGGLKCTDMGSPHTRFQEQHVVLLLKIAFERR